MVNFAENLQHEQFDHWYERVRYEAVRFPFYDLVSVARYCAKYYRKKYSANPALIEHFNRQKERDVLHNGGIDRTAALSIGMVGDIMWIRKGWWDFLSAEVLAHLKNSDIILGNLETPVSTEHPVNEFLPDLVRFNSPTAMLDVLERCFTAVSVVNNHALDQGVAGLRNTLRELDSRNILHAGAQTDEQSRNYAMIKKNDRKVAFLAYAWGLNDSARETATAAAKLNLLNLSDHTAPVDYSSVEEHIKTARSEGADLIICSLHWGYEFEMYPTYRMMKVARELIARGVDVIMGHHPHVLQPFELIDVNADRPFGFDNIQDSSRSGYRRAAVFYSLGNFVSAMYTKECRSSCIVNIDFTEDSGKLALASLSYLPVCCTRNMLEEPGAKVVSLPDELRKKRPDSVQRYFTARYRDITAHLGLAYMAHRT
jgi:poly-gamma-glutamate capsule biosynthesis protein CapA/YwtB (metallophosphatase superfamily)